MTENGIAGDEDGNKQYFGLEPGAQYTRVGGGLFVSILCIIACTCTTCYIVKNKE